MGRAIPTPDFNMETQVANYPVYLILLLGSYAIIPVQGNCFSTKYVTHTSLVNDRAEPCIVPNCPKEFFCPQDGCQTATITNTVQVPSTWAAPVFPRDDCYLLSCLPASTQAVTCANQATACPNTVTRTEISLAAQHHYPLPCYEPECPREFVCPNDSCQTAYVTRTMILPSTAAVLPASSAKPCAFNSCLPPVQETVCELTFSATP